MTKAFGLEAKGLTKAWRNPAVQIQRARPVPPVRTAPSPAAPTAADPFSEDAREAGDIDPELALQFN